MSGFQRDMIVECTRLLEGKPISPRTAETLRNLIGWRDELLAHIALNRDAFLRHPRLETVLARVAKTASAVQSTRRQEHVDAVSRSRAYERLDIAMGNLIAEAVKQSESDVAAIEALRHFIKQGSAEPGAHHPRMIPPPFDVQK